ncbi:response regulator [Rhizobium sp. WSM1274]|uniref:response regulator transcription factor n=1 Tax=Rhizobium TaxID=379 RepID=UPI00147861D2|nr:MULTISPECIES: response regulator [Rhizobium]MBW8786837.1 response regulator [Rhizobium leguminosarum]MBY5368389.1 response regulator [Rhizobium leguminosarum]MBY5450619.1 response regulator [Rhizobium leguminosarum]NNH55867.1 response regulator [Rhizobium laguerreae]UWU27600.1 response regulator [Rhizobium leguminosarum bv. viciae]
MPIKRPLIAIVDDDESMRDAIKGLMRSMGFDAESFSSADDFLMSPHIRRTACLVTDINMPGTSGLDLHRRLVALGKSIPTILITAFPEKNMGASALDADVVGCLTKPFNGQFLLDYIRSALAPNGEGESGS